MPYKYFPIEFSSYEDYVKYLKEKGFAIEALEGMYDTKNDDCNLFFADEKELKAN